MNSSAQFGNSALRNDSLNSDSDFAHLIPDAAIVPEVPLSVVATCAAMLILNIVVGLTANALICAAVVSSKYVNKCSFFRFYKPCQLKTTRISLFLRRLSFR